MKIRPVNLFWIIALAVIVGGIIYVLIPPRPDIHGRQIVADARQSLRQQGFKTDLADFDFSTPPEMRTRENILKATASNQNSGPLDNPNLMEIVGTNSAIVVWKQDLLKKMNPSWPDDSDALTWDDFHKILDVDHAQVDAACDAILSGPFAFNLDASHGNAMLLPHLAVVKNLAQTLGSWMVLALHNGDKNTAWTNLLAATRLVTAWKVEPAEISHMVRFATTKIVFAATWQALQADNWPDEQLTRLQTEWESADFLTNLPETAAFKRASDVAAYDIDRKEALQPPMPFKDFFSETWPNPLNFWDEFRSRSRQNAYLNGGKYDEEKDLLLFYRDREIELRNAVQAPTWMQMRQLPGVTNQIRFQSKYSSRTQAIFNMREINMRFQREGTTLPGRAAEAEAERRILITAVAFERYRAKHGSYPQTLAQLAPEFLKTVPVDFMDGQPLRYRLMEDGHFILYSVGQDFVDNGGKTLGREDRMAVLRESRSTGISPESDIVWPLPASESEVTALHQKEKHAIELRNLSEQERESEQEWEQSPLRQSRVEKILATEWSSDTNMEIYAGKRVVDIVSNGKSSGTNLLSIAKLLTPRQIITGNEPEDLTFDVPIAYDVITNMGALVLLADADTEEPMMPDSGAKVQDCMCATNNDCLLIWHTIFDPLGKHAVQVQLVLSTQRGGEFFLKGPAISVVTSNLCQFNLASAHFNQESGADFQARLPESNGTYIAEMKTTDGILLKTITGATSNGIIKVHWDLIDENGIRLTNDFFNSIFHINLPDSGRSQTLRGP